MSSPVNGPAPSTLAWDQRAVWHPYTQMYSAPPPLAIARGEGAWLIAEDGRRYLDAIASWWVTLHGHAEPAIVDAIARQARELEQVIFAGCTHRPAAELAARLTEILPAGLSRVFYSDNGSTAVEVALKMALQYWRLRREPARTRFLALEHAYHGDTVAAMSVSAPSYFTSDFQPLLFPVLRAPAAWCYRCPMGLSRAACEIDCLQPMETLLAAQAGQIAAVLVEPLLQGAGGMIVHPREFLAGVRRLCNQYGVLLIADEVLTGFGRTGAMFACELAGISPDIICLSKGLTGGFLPLSATVTTEAVYQAFLSPRPEHAFFHGHSFTANPLGCAAALASLQIFAEKPVLRRVGQIEAIHQERLQALRAHPRVGDTRQIGVVAAVELRQDYDYLAACGPRLRQFYLDHGVLLRPLGNVIYVLPPYRITDAELHQVWDVIALSLDSPAVWNA